MNDIAKWQQVGSGKWVSLGCLRHILENLRFPLWQIHEQQNLLVLI